MDAAFRIGVPEVCPGGIADLRLLSVTVMTGCCNRDLGQLLGIVLQLPHWRLCVSGSAIPPASCRLLIVLLFAKLHRASALPWTGRLR
jgi:hypothetical protein